jgi:hypothetical protein
VRTPAVSAATRVTPNQHRSSTPDPIAGLVRPACQLARVRLWHVSAKLLNAGGLLPRWVGGSVTACNGSFPRGWRDAGDGELGGCPATELFDGLRFSFSIFGCSSGCSDPTNPPPMVAPAPPSDSLSPSFALPRERIAQGKRRSRCRSRFRERRVLSSGRLRPEIFCRRGGHAGAGGRRTWP